MLRKTLPSRQEALRWLDRQVADSQGTAAVPARRVGDTPTLTEFAEQWLAGRNDLSTPTIEKYQDTIRLWIAPSIGHVKIDALVRGDTLRFTQYLSTKVIRGGKPSKVASQRIRFRDLTTIINAAVEEDLLLRNPIKRGDGPRPSDTERSVPLQERILNTENLSKVTYTLDSEEWACTPENHAAGRCSAKFMVRLLTGARLSMVLALLVGDHARAERGQGFTLTFHQQARRSHWQHGCDDNHPCGKNRDRCPLRHSGGFMVAIPGLKGDPDGRLVVPVNHDLGSALLRHKVALRNTYGSIAQTDFLFGINLATMSYPERDRKEWEVLMKAAGIDRHHRLHDLRHTAGSILALDGDMAATQAVLGHSTLRTTLLYQGTDLTRVGTAIDAAGERLRASRATRQAVLDREVDRQALIALSAAWEREEALAAAVEASRTPINDLVEQQRARVSARVEAATDSTETPDAEETS